jgi:hypothetical protein
MTDEGFVFIGELQAGDYVLAFNEATGEIGYYPILAVWAHEDRVIQYLTIDGEQIVTTPNHPFQTGTGEWLPAGELQVGDTIHTAQGGTGIVQAITFVYQPQPMYNLTVATAHTYFVGNGQWLVHNRCPWRGKPVMHTGDSDKGWIHIEGRHITGVLPNPKGGPSDLFAPGTTRQQLERAADIIVKKGVRISDPNNVIQVFEKRMKINGLSDRVRIIVDSTDGYIITMFPARSN